MSERQSLIADLPLEKNHGLHEIAAKPNRRPFFGLLLVSALMILALTFACIYALPTNDCFSKSSVLLISIDGFRPEYLSRNLTPTIAMLAASGVRAASMMPVFPSITFPNHYSIVTGLYPESHGVVGNVFFDSRLNDTFVYTSPRSNHDGKWWLGEPNMRAATMFWPGSEAEIKGTRPTYYEAYDSSVTLASKVAKVLEWMDMPCKTRPIFTALYIPDVDHAGHEQGPDSLQVNETLSFVDSHLKSLLFGLESRSILKNMNIIIVSDHGMASSHSDRVRFIDDYIDLTNVKVIENGPIFMLYPTSSKQFDLLEQGALRDGNFQGWNLVQERASYDPSKPPFPPGEHGYDTKNAEMQAIFIANGPYFKSGQIIESFGNVNVYNLMASIMGLDAASNNGTAQWLKQF